MLIAVKKMKDIEISVVIPAYNEGKYIGHVFRGLSRQTFRNFEVIVAVKSANDDTIPVAKRHGARIVLQRSRNIAGARNDGVAAAKGSIILFTNADTEPDAHLLARFHAAFKDKTVVAASGPLLPLEKTTEFIRFGYKFASIYLAKLSYALGTPAISASNFAVRKSAFKAVGGFDQDLATYEDLDLSKRLKSKGKIIYLDDAMVKSSTRRIVAWGVPRYIYFNASNVVRYNLTKKPATEYEPIR